MAQLSSFFDANMVNGVPDRQYDATAWANYFSGFIGNGVSNSPANNLQVVAGTGLSVIVNPGIGYINGYYYNNTEPLTVNINTANATYPRITSIVIELNLNNREIICKTIDGNAQTSPTAPQLIQTPSTYQLQLATVYIPAGAINVGTITDTRAESNVCGWVNVLVPTPPPPIITNAQITGKVVVDTDGSIDFNNANGTNILNEEVNGNTFSLKNSQTNNNIYNVNPVTSGLDTVNVGANINFEQAPNLEGGLQALGTNITQYQTANFQVLIAPNTTATCEVSWFLFNAPLLTGNNLKGSIGILNVNLTLNNTYYWPPDNEPHVDVNNMPSALCRSMTPFPPFQVGSLRGLIFLYGNNVNLVANTTYTTQCLMWE